MTATLMKNNLIAQLDKLPYNLQLRVLDYAKALIPKGIQGKTLLRFEGTIPAEDLQLMSKAIEEGQPIPENDIWIAAIAQQHDLTLVTKDVHFDAIDRLKIEKW